MYNVADEGSVRFSVTVRPTLISFMLTLPGILVAGRIGAS